MRFHPLIPACIAFMAGLDVRAASDSFAGRTLISGYPASATGSNVGATAEVGEPDHAANPATASLWWKWTSPVTAEVEINTFSSTFDTLLAVYTGTTLATLTEVASNDEAPSAPFVSQVRFPAVSGTEYQIAVDGWNGDTGDIQLNLLSAPVAPPNNNFSAPTVIPANAPQTVTGTNLGANEETGERVLGAGRTVWWRWTCPAGQAGTYEVDTVGSPIDTVLAVYTGTAVDALARRALNDDIDAAASNLASRVRFNAVANTQYRFTVDGAMFSGNGEGDITLNLRKITPAVTSPANDNFAAAAVITGSTGTVSGSNILSSAQAGEPDHGFEPVAASVWYTWTPPASTGRAEIILTFTNGVRGVVAAYTGAALAGLTPLAVETAEFTNGAHRVRFTPPSGQVLRIAVDGDFGSQERFSLKYRSNLPSPPANDGFTNGFAVASIPFTASYSNQYATVEPDDGNLPLEPLASTVWFKWTCATQTTLRVQAAGSPGFSPWLVVSTGPDAQNQTWVADGNEATTFNALAGTTYRFMVGGYDGEEGPFTLMLEETAPLPPPNDNLADAEFIGAGSTPLFDGTLASATVETGEAPPDATRSVWYEWMAPHDGPAEILVASTFAPYRVNIYTGNVFTQQVPVASFAGFTNGTAVAYAFDAEWNTDYFIQISDAGSGTAAAFQIGASLPFPAGGFKIRNFARNALGNLDLEWEAVRGIEYSLLSGPGPSSTNNLLVYSAVATQQLMRVACCPPPTNNVSTLFVEAAEAGAVGPIGN